MSHKFKNIKKVVFIVCLALAGVLLIPIGFSYFVATGFVSGHGYAQMPAFYPEIIDYTDDESSVVYLIDTITNGSALAPGAEGKFKIDIDLSRTGGANAYYSIGIHDDYSNIPNNLHLYVDKEMTSEFNSIEGVQLASKTNKTVEHYIYWKWDIVDTPEANANDKLYMDRSISIYFNINVSQYYGNYEILLVNDVENPTGRIALGNTSGNFNMKLDFSRFGSSYSRNVYFDGEDLGDIHLYSDANYEHEMTSLSVPADPQSAVINTPVYWRCEGTCNSGGLYYIVYS